MAMTRRGMMTTGLAAGLAALAMAPHPARATVATLWGSAFGGDWRLVTGDAVGPTAKAMIAARIARIDATMSPYRAGSSLSRFNRAAAGERVEIPVQMAGVIRTALHLAETTQGAFDPTIGPLVHRYGFGPITGRAGAPEQIALQGGTLRKAAPFVTLDLCGIAKGHALDDILSVLREAGARDVLLELGGEVRALGHHPSGRPWQVAIEDPYLPGLGARHIVAPGAMALATSGHRANGLIGDVGISHVIDPRARRPATGFAGSVSVLAESGAEADGMATALLAMGVAGPGFAQARGIAALFLFDPRTPEASIMTGEFGDHVLA